jgi:hypothetical protein
LNVKAVTWTESFAIVGWSSLAAELPAGGARLSPPKIETAVMKKEIPPAILPLQVENLVKGLLLELGLFDLIET